jgi:hypothetical protein
MLKDERMSLFISYYFIMPIVISGINITKPKLILFILPALNDVLNAVALQTEDEEALKFAFTNAM